MSGFENLKSVVASIKSFLIKSRLY